MFVGLDLSLRATGCTVLDPNDLPNCLVKTIRVNEKLRDGIRLQAIARELGQVFLGKSITLVAIEGYSFGSKNNQFQLGEVGGITRLLLTDLSVPYIIIPPNVLKKWTTGNGNADKIAMAICTYERFGLKFEDDNQCDAFNLATIAAAYTGEPMHRITADHRKMLDVIRANPLGLPKGKKAK